MSYLLLFLAVAAGYIIALVLQKKEMRHMSIFLAFSGAFLLAVTIFELMPEVYATPSKNIGVYIMAGILLQIFLDFFSKGAEHGHVHLHSDNKNFPWLLFLSLAVHAFLEGFPISETNNLLLGIIVHKIPIAVILSVFFIKAEYSNAVIVSFLTLFALMTPLGNWVSHNFSGIEIYKNEINALVIGIFLHVSTTILFESNKDHRFNSAKLLSIISAIVLAYLL